MKRVVIILSLAGLLALPGCKSAQQPIESYHVPAQHRIIHQKMLQEQHKFLPILSDSNNESEL